MKKLIIIPVFIIAVCVSAFSVRAEEINYDMSGIYDSLSDDAKAHMLSLGADSADASDLSDLSGLGGNREDGCRESRLAAQGSDFDYRNAPDLLYADRV